MTVSHNRIIFVVNPGSTSTKLAVYDGGKECGREVVRNTSVESGAPVWEQFDERLRRSLEWFGQRKENPAAVVGMGGLLRPLEGGTFLVSDRMIRDARRNLQGEHASNLGCVMAYEIAKKYSVSAYTVDPVSVDELEPLARISGHPSIERKSLSHALNIHAAVRKAAALAEIPVHASSFVVAHMGGGISIAAVRNGQVIDVNDASSDGPFSPERTGGLPLQQFISLCFSGRMTEADMRSLVMGKGGMLAYLDTISAEEVEKRIQAGDKHAQKIFEAMAYQISKEIGAMATVLRGNVNGIVLTGGLAVSALLVAWISDRVRFMAPIIHLPGELEMEALALGALRVLEGEEQPKEY